MKIQLVRPQLNAEDILELTIICTHLGWELVINKDKGQFIIIGNDDIAYIQKHEVLGVNFIWRKTKSIQYVKTTLEVIELLNTYDVIPEPCDTFNEKLIKGFQRLIGWKPGVTLKELYGDR